MNHQQFSALTTHIDKIEAKIDARLSKFEEALLQMARMEEQITVLYRKTDSQQEQLSKLLEQLWTMEKISYSRNHFFRWGERVAIIALTGMLTFMGQYLMNNNIHL